MTAKIWILLIMVGLLCLVLLAYSCFSKDSNDKSLKRLQAGEQLKWPAEGQAAIGSIKAGVLALSSGNEKLQPIASITKVITALAIMEKQPFRPGQKGSTYHITSNDIERNNVYKSDGGSALPLFTGMKLTQAEAMQRMLMASDNIMADVLVERIFGSMDMYVSYSNEMLKRMGLTQTVVADASGFNPETVSTASELIEIGIAALRNPVIAKIVAQQQAAIPEAGIIKNTNQMLGINGTIGIKTGTTDKAGSCLLFAARYTTSAGKKDTIIGVIMGDKNHERLYADSRALLLSAKNNYGGVDVQPNKNIAISPGKRRGLSPKQ